MPEEQNLCEVIITAPDEARLAGFTRRLVEHRLAACGHHSPIRSIYTWDGSIHDTHETRVALHTQAARVEAIIDAVNAEHPYQVPCVVSMPITNANPGYRDWVLDATT